MGSLSFSMELNRRSSHSHSHSRRTLTENAAFIKPQFFDIIRDTGNVDADEAEDKIAWLRSQIIGSDTEFDTPFGRRHLTYADHTASGRPLWSIEEHIAQKVLPYYGNTHTGDSHVGQVMSKMVHDAGDFVKRCMGGGHEDALLFCGSGTTAAIKRLQEVMGLTVPSVMRERVVRTMRDEERWVVFIGPYEHHSNILSWRQSLADVVEIGTDRDGLVDKDALRRELASPKYDGRPKLGSFSACSNVTGIYTGTRALARLLHRHGAFACFDFATSGPYQDIDMRSGQEEGYDAVFLSPHKFLGGPGTPGVLLMNKALYLLKSNPPSTCGGGTVSYVNGFSEKDTLYYENVEEREDAGTPQIIQKIRTALSFWVKDYVGHELIDFHERLYIEVALRRLIPNPNIHVLGNTRVKRQPIVSFLVFPPGSETLHENGSNRGVPRHPNTTAGDHNGGVYKKGKHLHGRFVAKLLNDLFGIQARGGCACAAPYANLLLGIDANLSLALRSAIQKGYEALKPGWTRASFSYYTSKEEFALVLAAMEFVAEHGHRFLPLYHLDWKSGNWTFRKRALKYQLMRKELSNALSDFSLSDGVLTRHSSNKGSEGEGWPLQEGDLKDVLQGTSNHEGKENGRTYSSYMEAARGIAKLLPENPTPRKIPDDVDLSLVLFRI